MRLSKRFAAVAALIIILSVSSTVFAAGQPASVPGPKDKCPVCGMFVGKYPAWAAEVRFNNATSAWFDGPKDCFACMLDMKKYSPGKTAAQVTAVLVNDYYTLKPIDGRKAFYVAGSDVYGPMGAELVPFAKEQDAREFMADHNGKRLLRFGEVTKAVLDTLEQ